MSLAAIVEALEAELGTLAPDVKFKDGPEHLVEGAPPRIVAVPTEELLGPAEEYWTSSVRVLAQREASVEFHLWAKTRAGAEMLIATLVTALERSVGKAYRLGTGRWITQDAEALMKHGRAYVLPVTFAIPVPLVEDAASQEATIGGTDTSDVALAESVVTEP
jgi:hypothetical protein